MQRLEFWNRFYVEFGFGIIRKPTCNLFDQIKTFRASKFEKFVAMDAFYKGAKIGNMEITHLGNCFGYNFLGKTETRVNPAMINVQKIREPVSDSSIITKLGNGYKTALAHFWETLIWRCSDVSNGFEGIAAYVVPDNGDERNLNPLAIFALLYSGHQGLQIGAVPIPSTSKWHAGFQIMSYAV